MSKYIFFILIYQIFITISLIKISKTKGLIDIPNNRKIHTSPIPYTGGLTLSLTYIFIIYLTEIEYVFLNLILAYAFIISLTGFIDDRYNVRPGTKLLLQSVPIFFLIDQNLYLTNLGSYSFLGVLELGAMDKIFTFLCCLLLINAFNYNDGIDGLLPSISIIILLSFVIFLIFYGSIEYKNFLLVTFPLTIFLFFNFGLIKKFKIFLGDSGSNLLGFIISFISIFLFIEMKIHPAIIIWPLAYTVYEFLSITCFRILENKGTFKPGRDHLHYELIKILKINQYISLSIILLINIILIIIGFYIFHKLGPDISLIFFILFFLIYLVFKYSIRKLSS